MSLPNDPVPVPHDDALVASLVRAASDAEAAGCPDAEALGMYAERGLDAQERTRLDQHVQGCGRCQAIVAAMVRSMPDVQESAVGGAVRDAGFAAWLAGWRWLVPRGLAGRRGHGGRVDRPRPVG